MSKVEMCEKTATPLTTSADSESFDTWTVINDKADDLTTHNIPSPPPTPKKRTITEDAEDAIQVETLNNSDDVLDNRYTEIDDLSDGISIISECESVGRISPHPELRKHLSELNIRFGDVLQPSIGISNSVCDATSQNYEASSEHSSENTHQVEQVKENTRRNRKSSRQLVESPSDLQPTIQIGLRGLFYVGALLGILAFLSKLKYESVLGSNTNVLSDKINDLELKNNLMRAEIDILSKQVRYLTTLSENEKYSTSNKQKSNASKEKKFKVWPGNGDTIENVEVDEKDLKTPFKCAGQNNIDIAGMCLNTPKKGESIVDYVGEKVRNVLEDTDHFANLEKVVDKVVKITGNPFNVNKAAEKPLETTEKPETVQPKDDDFTPHEHKSEKHESKKYEKYDNREKESYKKHKNYNNSGEHKEGYRKSRSDNDSGERKEHYRKNRSDSEERKERYSKDRSSEDHNESGENYRKSKDFKKFYKYSEEHENAKRESDSNWHEKLMQHRENSRKNNDKQRHDKNWYIERGDSRESARASDQRHR